jgi:hypothetical protein
MASIVYNFFNTQMICTPRLGQIVRVTRLDNFLLIKLLLEVRGDFLNMKKPKEKTPFWATFCFNIFSHFLINEWF